MPEKPVFGPITRLIHGKGSNPDEVGTRAHTFPIVQTSTFRFKTASEGAQMFEGKINLDAYSRVSNPQPPHSGRTSLHS